jgi:hypothetical protein
VGSRQQRHWGGGGERWGGLRRSKGGRGWESALVSQQLCAKTGSLRDGREE